MFTFNKLIYKKLLLFDDFQLGIVVWPQYKFIAYAHNEFLVNFQTLKWVCNVYSKLKSNSGQIKLSKRFLRYRNDIKIKPLKLLIPTCWITHDHCGICELSLQYRFVDHANNHLCNLVVSTLLVIFIRKRNRFHHLKTPQKPWAICNDNI